MSPETRIDTPEALPANNASNANSANPAAGSLPAVRRRHPAPQARSAGSSRARGLADARRPGRRLAALVLVPLLGLAGCSANHSGPLDRKELERAIRARGLDPATVVVPFELTPEIIAWLHKSFPPGVVKEERIDHLLDLLLERQQHLEYQAGHTATAREVFETRRANCMGFTSLFVGLARELDIPVYFLLVEDVEKFEKDGDLVVVSGHITAGSGNGRETRVIDFSEKVPGYHRLRPMSDLTAIALYHSNRGAEELRAGRTQDALVWLRKAVALDPDLAGGWVNLGVALRRSGDPEAAESSYRRALEADPSSVSAYENLASLLRLQGKEQEAQELMAASSRLDTRNPYNYMALGDLSFEHHHLDEARRYYQKARHLDGKSPEPYAALGELALSTGDVDSAFQWLRRAITLGSQNARVKRLAAHLKTNA